jgi:hypothetical protein
MKKELQSMDVLVKKVGNKLYRYKKITYFSDVTLKKGEGLITFFEKNGAFATNGKDGKNFIESSLGGDIKGFVVELYNKDYEPIILTPSQDTILKALAVFRNSAIIQVTVAEKPILTETLSKILPPMFGYMKGEAGSAGNPMIPIFQDHLPIGANPHMPIIGFGNQVLRLDKDSSLSVTIKFKGTTIKVPDALDTMLISVTALVDEYLEQVAMPAQAVA